MLDADEIAGAPAAATEAATEDEADLYPATAAQRRLWFLDRLQPGLTAYNLVTTIDLRGPLDPLRLRAAVGAVVRRHDALRTFFAEFEGSLWQVVLPRLDVPLPVIDLSALPADRRPDAAPAPLAFDLRQAPLLRLRLLRHTVSHHALRVEIHHIIADGRSLRILARDLLAAYAAGSRAPWPAPAGQFSAFAAGQARTRSREALEPGLAYWRKRLDGAPSLQQLPVDRARPRRPSWQAAVERGTVAAGSSPALAALADAGRSERATPFITLLATWLVLLHRWSWRTDLLVGTPVTSRDRPELADAIGFFVDVVVIRVRTDGRASFLEMLRRTRDAVLDAMAHQEVPLDLVVDELRLDRRLDHQPFLQVLFGLSEEADEEMRAGGLEARLVEAEGDEGAKGDLSLVLDLGENGVNAWLKYAVELYDGRTVQRLLRGYGRLLAGLAADPGRPCGELPMMDDGELQQVLREWSRAGRPVPPRCPVHEAFRRCAERSPGAPALEFPEGSLSYGELEARSNRLARVLAGLGVGLGIGAESPVGICLKPSVDFVVAALAVLKAGGAYLPLDPGFPAPRLATMASAAGLRWVVTRSEAAAGLPGGACEPVFLDRLQPRLDAADPGPFAAPCTPESLAYVMFTSGSTGVPKGVAVPHRAIHRLVVDSDFLRLGEDDRVAMAAHPGFDASTLEIWGALLNGGCLVGIPGELLLSPGDFFAHLAATRVTTLWLTKSLFDQMALHDSTGFAGLTHLMTGGEALDAGMVRHALAHLEPGRPLLHNAYGPTENTTFTTVHAITEVPEQALGISIGRPIRGTYVHLAGPDLRPVRAGVAGELYAGGEGLARGYVGAPAATAAAFVPDPFGEVPGARLYKTGDLARWRADGTLEFLGRIDHQVKIHGFRIEPAEIEAELARHPGVRAAAVVAREDEPGVKRLAAYVVPAGPGDPDLPGLRAFLAARLPSFLVPHAFLALPALPVNANGKLDREALPRPDSSIAAVTGEAAPRTAVERALVEIWQEVLQQPAVGIHDNFFHIGGDSILSIRLVARARQQGLEISPGLLFEAQTVAGLAAALEQAEPAPLSPVQRWFLDEVPDAPAGYARWMVLRLCRPLDPDLLEAALDRLCARHEALRRRFERGPDGWRQTLGDGADRPRVSRHDLTGLSDFAAAERIEAEAERLAAALDLAAAPPFQLALFDRQPQQLLIVLHQLVADTRSCALVLAELERACEAAGPEDPPRAAPWFSERAWMPRRATLKGDAASGTGLARLVDDAVRRAAPHRLDRRLSFYFTPGQTATVLETVPSRYRVAPADLVLAALAVTLTRWARASSLLVDVIEPAVPQEARRTIGWHATRERLLLDLSGAADPDSCLAAVKEARRLEDGRDRWPLPELLFLYRGAADLLPPGSRLFCGVRTGGLSDTGSVRAAHHAIGVAAAVVEGRLTVEWAYDAHLFHPLVLEGLMRDHASAIMALTEHCLESPRAGYTASDFPLAGLDRDELERLLGDGRDVEDLYALTPLQESMLAHSLGLPRSEVNFEQLCHAIDGAFDASAFERAWELALERHAILRTAFLWQGLSRPLQAVRRKLRLPLHVFDWRRLAPQKQESRLARLLARDRARGFQLDRAPLLRLAIVRVADDRAYVVFSFHHALLDGWSLERLDREILQGFEALRSGAVPAFEPARPFRDYVAWLESQDPGEAREAFRALLGSFREPVEIPTTADGMADGGAPERSGEKRRVLSQDESARLSRFAQRHGITLGTLTQAAWGLWLGRAFGRDDVVFGLTISGRPADLPGVEEMLGLFIHNIPVRLRPGDGPLLAWLQDLQAQVARTAGLAAIPEAELQRLSGVPPSRRFYETLVVVENLPSGEEAWSGLADLRLERVSSQLETSHALTLVAIPGERIELRLVHRVPRIPEDAAQQILDDVCALLLALPAAAELGTAALPEPRSARALLPRAPSPGLAAGGRPDLPAVPAVLPRDLLELRLSQIAEEVLALRLPGVTANLFDCGLDSVRLARLSRRLGEELGRALPFAVLFERPTVAGLAEWLRAGAVELAWSPLVALQTAAHSAHPRPAFYCVHPLAGNVIAFLELASAMGEDQPFYALQAPGADGSHEPLDRLEDIAALYVDAVRRRQPRGPYRLGGYSFGGVVAFEMARQMYEQGDEVALLAILDTPAPQEAHPGEDNDKDDLFWLRQIVHMRERFLGLDLGLAGEELRELAEEERLRRVADVLASAEVLPAGADAALMRQLVRVSRAQYQAYISYRPAGPYPGKITLLRSQDLHPSEASAHLRRAFQDLAMGWRALSPLPVRVLHVPGDHVTMLVRPQVETVASRLRDAILAV